MVHYRGLANGVPAKPGFTPFAARFNATPFPFYGGGADEPLHGDKKPYTLNPIHKLVEGHLTLKLISRLASRPMIN